MRGVLKRKVVVGKGAGEEGSNREGVGEEDFGVDSRTGSQELGFFICYKRK